MSKYLPTFFNQLNIQLSYKFNFISNIFVNLLGIVISIFTWNGIFESTSVETIGGFTKTQMIYYIIISNIGMILFSSESVVNMGHLVRTGKLTSMLVRPYSILVNSFFGFLGKKFIFIIGYVFMFILAFFVNANIGYFFLVFLLFIINFCMFFMLVSLVGNLGFYLINMWTLRPLINSIYLLLGGLLFPLNLFGNKIYKIVDKNPFAIVGFNFTRAMQGKLTIEELIFYIILSFSWLILFFVLYNITYYFGLKRYEGMGA